MTALFLSACTSAHTTQARQAERDGRLEEAWQAWAARLAESPADSEALAGYQRASDALVQRELSSLDADVREGRLFEALASYARARRFAVPAARALDAPAGGDGGSLVPDAARGGEAPATRGELLTPALAHARQALTQAVEARLDFHLSVGQPLSAGKLLAGLSPSLQAVGLGDVVATRTKEVRAAGSRRCLALAQVASTPWLARFAELACVALRAPTPRVPVPPEARRELRIDTSAVRGASDSSADKLRDAARAAFARTAWYDARASGEVEGRVTAVLDSRVTSTPMDLTVSWSETETYSTTEYQTETYQEPYTTTESYTYGCYSGSKYTTCTGTRTVTHYRTATRSVPKTVTKTRVVGRSTTIPARKEQAAHRARVSCTVALPGTTRALEVAWEDSAEKDGVAHDVTDPRASLVPQRSGIPTAADWEDRQARRLYDALEARLRRWWSDSFCVTGEQAPETAARCLLGSGDVRPQPDARIALARFLGEPPALVDELLAPLTARATASTSDRPADDLSQTHGL
ncbi:MAG: hypothetical protein AB1938_31405 [Myxococcota bacterium]